ncbi:tlde1 domain-containing protein [Cupriavidus campinensis]|uniref:DUF2778 domain-containing protein n=1 Tax=Cupriavidus campinensis TaxID=151783 RepID=A0ABY3EP87_9BURK|nr:tlde1 domain-containing protein [Cupriavidus campinensis]TSP12537.1 DUF2778 domain-containing protein [Cupriavidus campinensis]
MQQCSFVLNDQPISAFSVGSASFPAFSGKTPYINKRANSCLVKLGPIPPGTYYIIDRETGGKRSRGSAVPGADFRAYGKVVVK